MSCWEFLGINPTDDKALIKDAYMEKLNVFHPEEDPEGFQKLRQSYEEALRQCETEKEVDNSPLGLWMQKVENLYSVFSKRIQPEYWQELLQDDVCFQIDSAEDASNRLLTFLMDNYRLPQAVWIALDNHFDWQNKREELYNKFPVAFVDFVINEISYADNIKYNLFEADDSKDFEKWFKVYYEFRDCLDNRDTEKAKQCLEEERELGINQPDMDVLELRYFMQIEDLETAREIGTNLVNRWSEDAGFLYAMGQVEYATENIETAKSYYEKALEYNPDYIGAHIGMGDCLLEMKQFKDAYEYYSKVHNLYPYNNYIIGCVQKCTEGLAENYSKIAEKEPDNVDNLFNLGWAYYDLGKYEDCKHIVDEIETKDYSKSNYYDLKGRVSSDTEDYQTALECFKTWLEFAESENDDSTDENSKNEEIAYIHKQIGIQYQYLGQYDKALEEYDIALKFIPESADTLNKKAFVLNKLEEYEQSVKVCDTAIELNSRIAHSYLNKAEALYNMRMYREALDNCEILDDIYPYFLNSYLIQIKIFFYVSEYQQALEIIKKVEDMEIENSEMISEIQLYKARTMDAMGQTEQAKEIYLDLIEKDSENDLASYYFACMCSDIESYDDSLYYVNKSIKSKDDTYKYYLRAYVYKKKRRYQKSLDDYNIIINREPNSDSAYNNRGLVYFEMREYDRAIEDYKKALSINSENITANNNIGEAYDRKRMYEESLKYYNRQIELDDNDYYYINRGWCFLRLNRFDEAMKDFKMASEIDPQNGYAYNGMAYTYKEQCEYDKAIEFFQKVLEINSNFGYAYRYMGQCYEELKKFEEADNYYTKAIEMYPDDEMLYLDRGLLYSNLKQYEKAIIDYQRAIDIDPNYSYAYNNMGVVYKNMSLYEKAIEYYKKAVEAKPDNYTALGNLAEVYFENVKDYSKAAYYYTKQIEIADGDADLYSERGEAYFKLGDIKKSKADYNAALKLYLEEFENKKSYACIYEDIGMCYERLDEKLKAIEYYKKAIELAPNCEDCRAKQCHESYYRLGNIEENDGNIEVALKYYKKAYDIKPENREYKEAIENLNKKSENKPKVMDKILKALKKIK